MTKDEILSGLWHRLSADYKPHTEGDKEYQYLLKELKRTVEEKSE